VYRAQVYHNFYIGIFCTPMFLHDFTFAALARIRSFFIQVIMDTLNGLIEFRFQ